MIPVRPPYILQKCLSSILWKVDVNQKILYLTFDDGPIPHVTPFVIDLLAKYNAKATFFCIGDNVKKHPHIYNELLSQNHTTGNHTFNHLNGWGTNDEAYLNNIKMAAQLINSNYFRPPYGRIKPSQMRLINGNYKIVLWDVLSKDYKQSLSGLQCFNNVKHNARPGSVVLFHDSIKAFARLKVALPLTLKYFTDEGYIFKALPQKP